MKNGYREADRALKIISRGYKNLESLRKELEKDTRDIVEEIMFKRRKVTV